jgi:hypothetical protein
MKYKRLQWTLYVTKKQGIRSTNKYFGGELHQKLVTWITNKEMEEQIQLPLLLPQQGLSPSSVPRPTELFPPPFRRSPAGLHLYACRC